MNWNLILWFAGVCATLAGLKFVVILFKSLFNKESMHSVLDAAGERISNVNEKLNDRIKQKTEERKVRKENEKRGVVIMRR